MLEPLCQFVCDTCGEIIEKPEDGWIEWIYDDSINKNISFNIVHHVKSSPEIHLNNEGCYQHGKSKGRMDAHLNYFIDKNNLMANLLHFIDLGKFHDPAGIHCKSVNLREYTELVRRLTIPYYEEARMYWDAAISDGCFDGANEIIIYTPDFLKKIIKLYSNR